MTLIKNLQLIEETRQLKQDEVDFSKSKKDRNKLGQFSTPRKLADDILSYAKKIHPSKKIKLFDPAFGMGSFYTAALKAFGPKVNTLGFEIDNEYYSASKDVWKEFESLEIIKTDFTKESPEAFGKANLIVCNPPYIRHQHLAQGMKDQLRVLSKKSSGKDISGLAGLHAHFMLLSHQWLEEDGVAIWLVPSEILEVNYGSAIREYLLENVDLQRIHFFNHAEGKFSDALVSSCVIAYRKSKPKNIAKVQITFGNDFLHPESKSAIHSRDLALRNKWSKHLLDDLHPVSNKKLGDVFSIKRGIATGDNSFFILTKEQALDLEIPKKYLRNVLPASRYLKGDVVRLDTDGFLDTEKKLVLLDVDLPLEQIKKLYPKLYLYLLAGIEKGIDKGYLASRRSLWYSHEKRESPKFFVRYMNRESKKEGSHHSIFVKNESDAIATNSYLMLYEKPQQLFQDANNTESVWSWLRKGLDKTLYRYGRTYGGGLVKFEPNELKEIPIFG
jgi:tRNA1(Val) A37 N6-methylase TrmN6